MGGETKAGPAEKQAAQQSKTAFEQTSPVLGMLSKYIQSAISGDMNQFMNKPSSQFRASQTRKTGERGKEQTRRGLASRGLENTSAGQGALANMDMEIGGAILDSLLQEMTNFVEMAPGFASMGSGQGGGLGLAQLEQQRAMGNAQARMAKGTAIGSSSGMIAGATAGSFIPVIGTAAGAMIGGALGGAVGGAVY